MVENVNPLPGFGPDDLDCGLSAGSRNGQVETVRAPRAAQVREGRMCGRIELEVGRRPHDLFAVQPILNHDFIAASLDWIASARSNAARIGRRRSPFLAGSRPVP